MKNVVITPRPLKGVVTSPPSKSAAHRAVICASLACGQGAVYPAVSSDDMEATIGAMKALGTEITRSGENLEINGETTFCRKNALINCRESGSTLRFLIPVAAAGGIESDFTGSGRLPLRPLGAYLELLPGAGVTCRSQGELPLAISGKLQPGVFRLAGNSSSQFITGLLLALPLLGGDSRIVLTTPLESSGYVDLTLSVMRDYGVAAEKTDDGFFIPGKQRYAVRSFQIERDWSQAAFWLVAGAIGSEISCGGLKPDSLQGDREIIRLLSRFGAGVTYENGLFSVHGGALSGIEIDASQIPDLVPILAVAACTARGITHIKNAARLRLKESDRLHSITLGLHALGADITETADGLVIRGTKKLRGGESDGFNDHRIVMALAIASVVCENPVVIHGCGCINKSYPDFFQHFKEAGGCADVIHVG